MERMGNVEVVTMVTRAHWPLCAVCGMKPGGGHSLDDGQLARFVAYHDRCEKG